MRINQNIDKSLFQPFGKSILKNISGFFTRNILNISSSFSIFSLSHASAKGDNKFTFTAFW